LPFCGDGVAFGALTAGAVSALFWRGGVHV